MAIHRDRVLFIYGVREYLNRWRICCSILKHGQEAVLHARGIAWQSAHDIIRKVHHDLIIKPLILLAALHYILHLTFYTSKLVHYQSYRSVTYKYTRLTILLARFTFIIHPNILCCIFVRWISPSRSTELLSASTEWLTAQRRWYQDGSVRVMFPLRQKLFFFFFISPSFWPLYTSLSLTRVLYTWMEKI